MSVYGTALLVTGPEDFLAAREVEQRRDAALAEQPDAEVNRISAVELGETHLSEVTGASLLASHIVAIIDDVGSTPPEVVDQVVALAAAPGEELCLILVHEGGNKGKGLIDKLKKARVPLAQAERVKAWKVPEFVRGEAKRRRLRLAPRAAEALIAAIGTDLRALVGAMEQLASDADADELDAALVQRYFAGRAEVTAYSVADAVLAGQTSRALEQLRWALETGVAGPQITASMAVSFRRMGRYLDLQGQRLRAGDLARELGLYPKQAEQLGQWSRNWQQGGVVQAIRLIAQADADVKGAAANADYALERMVLGVLDQRRR